MRTRWLAMLALLAVVAGCSSSSPHAAVPPLVTSTPTPSAAATPTASPAPAVTAPPPAFVSPATGAGAIAFALVYFKELDRAYASGDVSRLAPYRLATCSCLGFERDIRSYYSMGGKIDGEQIIIDRVISDRQGPSLTRVGVLFHTPVVKNYLPNKPITTTSPERGAYALTLKRLDRSYVIVEIQYKAEPAA